MSKNIYNGHEFELEPHGPGFKVRINGPVVNALAGTFATREQGVEYAMDRIDAKDDDGEASR